MDGFCRGLLPGLEGRQDAVTPDGRTYADHNAAAPIRPEAAEAVVRAMGLAGNPSSVHGEGRAARAEVERAREAVARLAATRAKAVVFTSGGTEAANLVLAPGFRRAGEAGATRLLVGATEHPCVLDGHRFAPEAVTRLPVSPEGVVRLDALRGALAAEAGPALVSLQLANGETGVVQPVAEAAAIVREAGGLLHVDAVQAAGRLPVDIGALGADAITLSAHKLGGPKGAGALVLASDRLEIADRLLRGGGQERGLRSGTENVAGIAGFGAAAEAALRSLDAEASRLRALRDAFEAELKRFAPSATIFGERAPRLPNTTAFAVPGLKAETALIALDLAGVAVSSGSACSSGKVRRSHVLLAMGVEPGLAEGALRVSFGWNSAHADVLRVAQACEKLVETLCKRRADAA